MVATISTAPAPEIFYPSSDGEPLAETSVHVDAIIHIVVALRQYLASQQAIVLADQFLYYAQGFPKLRVAPDIMVIWNVPPGPRDNFKTWEEGSAPAVIFEITSEGTRDQDQRHKKELYEQIDVQEYWLFDPKGEWIPEQLRGYRLVNEQYEPIIDGCSVPLNLRLVVAGSLLDLYRLDTGEKLLAPNELMIALQQEVLVRQDFEQQLENTEKKLENTEKKLENTENQLDQERQRASQAEAELQALKDRLQLMEGNP